MANTFTLDNLRADIDKEFSPVRLTLSDGDEIVMRSILRLGEKDRKAVLEHITKLQEAGSEVEPSGDAEKDTAEGAKRFEALQKHSSAIIEKIAQKGKGRKLLAELDGDVPLTLRIISTWIEATEPGEAESSPAS
jgi:Mycobacteriophage tail assembly protein